MTRDEAKAKCLERIIALQGVKATQLIADEGIFEVIKDGFDVCEICDELVAEGKILEVEYSVPELSFRAKSFFLPGGSFVRIIGEEPNGTERL